MTEDAPQNGKGPALTSGEAAAMLLQIAAETEVDGVAYLPGAKELNIQAKRLDLSILPAGVFTDLLCYWQSKCKDGRLPARADIDPLDFPQALGHVSLLDVCQDPLHFRFRLDGSLVAEHRGQDMTGRSTDEVRPLALANILRTHYTQVATSGEPNFHEIRFFQGAETVTYKGLALPLSDDGEQVTMILVCTLSTEALLDLL